MTTTDDWRQCKFVVVDLEGSGGQPPEIVELAIVTIESGSIRAGVQEWLVRPDLPITPTVTRIHGITNEMVAEAPHFHAIKDEVARSLGDDYLIAHNAQADYGVLGRYLRSWMPRGIIDTVRLAKAAMPGRKSYGLSALADELKLSAGNSAKAHRAGYDALLTARLFLALSQNDGAPRSLSWLLNPEPPAAPVPEPAQRSLF